MGRHPVPLPAVLVAQPSLSVFERKDTGSLSSIPIQQTVKSKYISISDLPVYQVVNLKTKAEQKLFLFSIILQLLPLFSSPSPLKSMRFVLSPAVFPERLDRLQNFCFLEDIWFHLFLNRMC